MLELRSLKKSIRDRTSAPIDDTAKFECLNLNRYRASLGGTTVRESGADGRIEFDDLRFRGITSVVLIKFELLGQPWVEARTNPFNYDPRSDYDNNIVGISAIKTISGIAPESEFFDLRFRFRIPFRMHVMANIDVALTARTNADSGVIATKAFDRSIAVAEPLRRCSRTSLRVMCPSGCYLSARNSRCSQPFPTMVFMLSAWKMGGSPFQGSSLSVAYLKKWYSDSTVVLSADPIHLAKHNLGFDFLIRSASV